MLRPASAQPVARTRPASPPTPLRPAPGEPPVSRKPIWDKDNFGFWLTVCVLISFIFSIAWRAVG